MAKVELSKEEKSKVVGGKVAACHVLESFKKTFEAGGLVFCLGRQNDRVFPVVQRIAGRENQDRIMSTVCALMVTGSIEVLSHVYESTLSIDCE